MPVIFGSILGLWAFHSLGSGTPVSVRDGLLSQHELQAEPVIG